jgi:putative transposase
MLSDQRMLLLCEQLGLSKQAQDVLATIRSSQPTRRVGGGRKNVTVRYPSRKMGVIIQAESHKNELAGVYEMEHDPNVLEFYDQPPPIKLQYLAKNGRSVGVLHTPDYFVIRALPPNNNVTSAIGWEEWKTEEELLWLGEKQPHRYVREEDGQWHCPPGERIAAPLGFFYRIRSSAEIHWRFLRNMLFLEDYLREDCPAVQAPVQDAVRSRVRDEPGLLLRDLLSQEIPSDAIYTMIAAEQLYVDVSAAPLAEPERVHVFCDEETARAWTVALASEAGIGPAHTILAEPGTSVV